MELGSLGVVVYIFLSKIILKQYSQLVNFNMLIRRRALSKVLNWPLKHILFTLKMNSPYCIT